MNPALKEKLTADLSALEQTLFTLHRDCGDQKERGTTGVAYMAVREAIAALNKLDVPEEKKEAFKAHWDKPPLSIDFDGPIHRYGRGWISADIYDEPTEGVHFALQKLVKTHALHILSARPALDILHWCRAKFPDLKFELIPPGTHYWQVEGVIGITNTKMPAITYIDDRAMRFTNWVDMRNYFQ